MNWMFWVLTAGLFPRIDLRALQPAAVIDVDRFPLREFVESHRAGLAMTVAGVLHAAEGQLDLGTDGWRVDVDDAGLHLVHGVERLAQVVGVDRHRQA